MRRSGTSPHGILSLDQEKAFDRVDWSFMHHTLSFMGFGPSFCGWVRLFYTGVSSAVLVNGYISDFFDLSRGVRQGCPLSALIYVLTAEVLACNIRACERIMGVSLPSDPGQQAVISQYADDTTIVCDSDDAVDASFEIYALYERASGARINTTKSKGLWLGPWRHRTDPTVQLRWSSSYLLVLGTFLGPDNLEEQNFRPRIESMTKVLDSWRQRQLSFRGKSLVVNALGLSGLWYTVSVLPDRTGSMPQLTRRSIPSCGRTRRNWWREPLSVNRPLMAESVSLASGTCG